MLGNVALEPQKVADFLVCCLLLPLPHEPKSHLEAGDSKERLQLHCFSGNLFCPFPPLCPYLSILSSGLRREEKKKG